MFLHSCTFFYQTKTEKNRDTSGPSQVLIGRKHNRQSIVSQATQAARAPSLQTLIAQLCVCVCVQARACV